MAESPTKSQPPPSPDTAVYHPPQTGIFPYLPRSLVPYAELMRLDRPSGFYAFYWHYAIGLAFATNLSSSPSSPSSTLSPTSLVTLATLTASWVILYRGAVCAWNDALDAEYDRRVARCRFRPVARGAVSVGNACAFAAALLGFAALPVWKFLPREAALGFGAMTLVLGVYPLGKRWTDFPQLVLGVGLAMPAGICAVAFGGMEGLGSMNGVRERGRGREGWALGSLYAADLLWTVIFDTVYAHQDIRDDVKAGVRSLAVRLGERTKPVLGLLGVVQVWLLVVTGVCARLSPGYFIITCGGSGAALLAMLVCVDLESPASCAWWFGPGSRLVGFSIVLGFMASYIPKYY